MFSKAIICFLFLLLNTAVWAQRVEDLPNRPTDRLISDSQKALQDKNLTYAWRALLEFDRRQPEGIEEIRQLVADVTKSIAGVAAEDRTGGRLEPSINRYGLLLEEPSQALLRKAWPGPSVDLLASISQAQAANFYQLGRNLKGSTETLGNSRDALLLAINLVPRGSAEFAQYSLEYAEVLKAIAFEVSRSGSPTGATESANLMQQALSVYETVAGFEELPEELAARAKQLLAQQRQALGVPDPDAPTPTPQPTPTPEPGFFEGFLPSGLSQGVREFFGESGDTISTIFNWVLIIGGIIFVFWGIPNFVLYFIATHYDVNAAEFKMQARKLGFIPLFGYFIWYSKNRTVVKEEKVRSACPHCAFNLEDYFAYEDLIFSRCPKCGEQVTPIITVEGYVERLAQMLATDVERINSGAESVEKIVGRDAMVRLVRAVVTLGVRRRASDIHVEPDENALVIRQRVDGMMTEMFTLPRSLALAVVSAIKVQGGMNIAERRIPQDGKMSTMVDKASIDIRIATSPASAGETATLRLLDMRSIQLETKHLGMSPKNQDLFDSTIHGPHGLMLVAGPTGSGKTTTLYVALQQIRPTNRNIISIEDPIEFRIPGVNQIQVNPVAGLTFASSLRSVLRQDPDVIMVGEIRDKETAEISVNSATTGHLVLSTLHTIDASASVARLIDLGVSPRQFADALALVLAQRLIRLVCSYCTEPMQPSMDTIKAMGLTAQEVEDFDFRRGAGCQVCNSTGYHRRTGIFEFLTPTDRLRSAMEKGSISTTEIRDIAVAGGMKTLRVESIDLLRQGLTTAEETLRVTK